ncbi:MAG: arsenate reductase (azurin) small subunit [Sedimenticola sp.]
MTDIEKKDESAAAHGQCMLNRREFLMYSGAAATAVSTISLGVLPGQAQARARVVGYPRKLVAKLSELKANTPVDFNYPDDGRNSQCFIVNMDGAKAGGGVGSKRDVVAFSYLCTHQGGFMNGKYQAVGEHRVLGQCPLHLSTYDMTRHGIIVSGQAYQSIPQVLLEVDGDDVYAVGVMGLLFGRSQNLMES